MKGFKDSTKTSYSTGGKAKAKVATVMHEFGKGDLHSGSAKGPKVTNQKQAVAIALSEGRKAVNKATGGYLKNAGSDSVHEARQLIRNNPDLANRAARLANVAQLRADLENPKSSPTARPSLVGIQGLKKGGKAKAVRKADGGPIVAAPMAAPAAPMASPRAAEMAKAVIRKAVVENAMRKARQPMAKPAFNQTPMVGNAAPMAVNPGQPMGLKKGGSAGSGKKGC